MTREDQIYKGPEGSDPDRFLDPNAPSAHGDAAIAFVLAVFNLSRAKDEPGTNIVPTAQGAQNSLI
ncbi:hypothetical protein FRC10_005058 [Ceratobasidium sp. 414]|nr:hypothetical protein FRC10_005058 [Ceratobasidium sp. 414]